MEDKNKVLTAASVAIIGADQMVGKIAKEIVKGENGTIIMVESKPEEIVFPIHNYRDLPIVTAERIKVSKHHNKKRIDKEKKKKMRKISKSSRKNNR